MLYYITLHCTVELSSQIPVRGVSRFEEVLCWCRTEVTQPLNGQKRIFSQYLVDIACMPTWYDIFLEKCDIISGNCFVEMFSIWDLLGSMQSSAEHIQVPRHSRKFPPKTFDQSESMWTVKILLHVNVVSIFILDQCLCKEMFAVVWTKFLPDWQTCTICGKVLTKMCKAKTNPNQYTHKMKMVMKTILAYY